MPKGYKPKNILEVYNKKLCQFMKGDPKINPEFCPNKKLKNSAYCEDHYNICIVKNKGIEDLIDE